MEQKNDCEPLCPDVVCSRCNFRRTLGLHLFGGRERAIILQRAKHDRHRHIIVDSSTLISFPQITETAAARASATHSRALHDHSWNSAWLRQQRRRVVQARHLDRLGGASHVLLLVYERRR